MDPLIESQLLHRCEATPGLSEHFESSADDYVKQRLEHLNLKDRLLAIDVRKTWPLLHGRKALLSTRIRRALNLTLSSCIR